MYKFGKILKADLEKKAKTFINQALTQKELIDAALIFAELILQLEA